MLSSLQSLVGEEVEAIRFGNDHIGLQFHLGILRSSQHVRVHVGARDLHSCDNAFVETLCGIISSKLVRVELVIDERIVLIVGNVEVMIPLRGVDDTPLLACLIPWRYFEESQKEHWQYFSDLRKS